MHHKQLGIVIWLCLLFYKNNFVAHTLLALLWHAAQWASQRKHFDLFWLILSGVGRSEDFRRALESYLRPIKQLCEEKLSQTRCASRISKGDLKDVRDAFRGSIPGQGCWEGCVYETRDFLVCYFPLKLQRAFLFGMSALCYRKEVRCSLVTECLKPSDEDSWVLLVYARKNLLGAADDIALQDCGCGLLHTVDERNLSFWCRGLVMYSLLSPCKIRLNANECLLQICRPWKRLPTQNFSADVSSELNFYTLLQLLSWQISGLPHIIDHQSMFSPGTRGMRSRQLLNIGGQSRLGHPEEGV